MATAALGNTYSGVAIYGGASGNSVGGTTPGSGDVISGNLDFGVYISDVGTTGNVVAGDDLGTDPSGTLPLGNGLAGVIVQDGATSNTIGGTSPNARDVLSANSFSGVDIGFSGTTGNVVEGDYIGVTADGAGALGNTYSGVNIYGGASGNLIGGTTPGSGDVVSDNSDYGVYISDDGTTGNVVEGDDIGTDSSGMLPLGNQEGGMLIQNGASDNTIGGTSTNARNVITANDGDGVDIGESGTTGNVIEGDDIGVTANGAAALGNTDNGAGVAIYGGASGNIIGGTAPGSGDVISGNAESGVYITDVGTSDNLVAGDDIGTDSSGTHPLGNGSDGVAIFNGATNNTIGGATAGAGNVISGNGYAGVDFYSGPNANIVAGNKIGTDVTGTVALVNQGNGIVISSGENNTIGGTTPGAGNLIAGNAPNPYAPSGSGYGVWITGQDANGNVLASNTIGTDITGTLALGNALAGVQNDPGEADNTIGGLTTSAGVFNGFDFASSTSVPDVTLRSDISSPSQPQTSGGSTVVYHLDVETEGRLLAIVNPQGFTAQLKLMDSQGRELVQSDGVRPAIRMP